MEEMIINQSLRQAVAQPSYAEAVSVIEEQIRNKSYRKLREIAEVIPAPDLAAIFGELEDRDEPILFRLLSKEQAAEVFVELEAETRERLMNILKENVTAYLNGNPQNVVNK